MKHPSRRSWAVAASMVLITVTGLADAAAVEAAKSADRAPKQGSHGGAKFVTTVEGVSEYRLSNGMRILLLPDESRPTITVNVTYFVGSRFEGYGETGMAHLLEHLVFKGTPAHPKLTEEISRRGGSANGTTTLDRTNYYQTFPASLENLEWSLGMEADRMVNSFISAKDLASEMTVVRNEWERGENSPSAVLSKRTFDAAYQWHGYGRSTIGERSDIENVPITRLQDFYRKYYQPDNAILIVSGRFDGKQALRIAENAFGSIAPPVRTGGNTLYPTYTREPAQDGERTVVLRRAGDVQRVMVMYHVPAAAHPEFASLDVLGHILGDAPSGRLYKALVETGLAASVSAGAASLSEPGVLIASATVRTEQSVETVKMALLETMEGLAAHPPTQEELDRVKTSMLNSWRLSLMDSAGVVLGLSDWAANGDWRLLFLHRDRLREASVNSVTDAAAHYLVASNRTVGLFLPDNAPRRAIVAEAPRPDVLMKNYNGDDVQAVAESFDSTPAAIEKRVIRDTLPGGARIALLPKTTRGNQVLMSMVFRLGNEQSLRNRLTDAEMAGALLQDGTSSHSRQALADELDRLQAQVTLAGDITSVAVDIQTVRENLPAVLALTMEMLRDPVMPSKEFEELRRGVLAGIEAQQGDPQAQASLAYRRHLSPWPVDHPNYRATPSEDLQRYQNATVEGARSFHKSFYGSGPGTTITVVGDFDVAQVKGLLLKSVDSWRAPQQFQRIAAPSLLVAPATVTIETPDKTNATLVAGLNIAMRDDDPDYPALVLGNEMLGGGFLNSRFTNRIRQKEGLSYGVSSRLTAHPIDKRGSFTFTSIFAPQNLERVEAAFREELAKALADGFTDDEVVQAKAGWMQSRKLALGTDGDIAGALGNDLYFGRTLEDETKLEERVQALSAIEVVQALRRHVDPAKITIVRAGDFKATAKP